MAHPTGGDWVWLETNARVFYARVFCPEQEIPGPFSANTSLKPLRGYGYTLAVFGPTGNCIGWTKIESTGFESVRAWMAAGSPQPE